MTTAAFARATYRDISLYAPDRTPCRVDLSDNTNLWGMPPAARDALADSVSPRYPSLYATELKVALADYTGVSPTMITTGCGSDDVLDSAMRALAEPGDRVAYSTPTFPMIPIFARMNGLNAVVAATDDLVRTDARLIYVCSPNNPTGTLIPRDAIERLLRTAGPDQVIIVDEAYAEFAGASVVDLARDYPRLLITRTMSKAFGLAGLRVGYAIGDPARVAEVEKSRGPYKVSAPAERAAVAALASDLGWVRERIDLVLENRTRLAGELRKRGLDPLASAANFLFVPVEGASTVAARMREIGVAVRAFDDPDGLRITVGPWPMLQEALGAFDEARR